MTCYHARTLRRSDPPKNLPNALFPPSKAMNETHPPRAPQTFTGVTLAAAVFVQRVDDYIMQIDAGELTATQAMRLQEYRAAAEIITQALIGAANGPRAAAG